MRVIVGCVADETAAGTQVVQLCHALTSELPVLMVGPPGAGKTTVWNTLLASLGAGSASVARRLDMHKDRALKAC